MLRSSLIRMWTTCWFFEMRTTHILVQIPLTSFHDVQLALTETPLSCDLGRRVDELVGDPSCDVFGIGGGQS